MTKPAPSLNPLPAFCICGWSGSGKSTLLRKLLPRFTAAGLRIAVVKHDVHGLDLDSEGKDSDRFFQAGADVLLCGPREGFLRSHPSAGVEERIERLDAEYDLVFAEGFKSARFARKVWLLKDAVEECPPDVPGVARVLAPEEDRAGIVGAMVEEWLRERLRSTPVRAGVLIGGASRRMGKPKHLLRAGNLTWLERIVSEIKSTLSEVVLLGGGAVPPSLRSLPRLPDVSDKDGPLAGMLAAMRWDPRACWVFLACDLPCVSRAAVEWLLRRRAPGVRAILPRLENSRAVEPLLALYESRSKLLLERCAAPSALAGFPGVVTPEPPGDIAAAWKSLNTPGELAAWHHADPAST